MLWIELVDDEISGCWIPPHVDPELASLLLLGTGVDAKLWVAARRLGRGSTLFPAVVGDCKEGGFPGGKALGDVEVGSGRQRFCRSVADEGGLGVVGVRVAGVVDVVRRVAGDCTGGGRDEERLVGGPVQSK